VLGITLTRTRSHDQVLRYSPGFGDLNIS